MKNVDKTDPVIVVGLECVLVAVLVGELVELVDDVVVEWLVLGGLVVELVE